MSPFLHSFTANFFKVYLFEYQSFIFKMCMFELLVFIFLSCKFIYLSFGIQVISYLYFWAAWFFFSFLSWFKGHLDYFEVATCRCSEILLVEITIHVGQFNFSLGENGTLIGNVTVDVLFVLNVTMNNLVSLGHFKTNFRCVCSHMF